MYQRKWNKSTMKRTALKRTRLHLLGVIFVIGLLAGTGSHRGWQERLAKFSSKQGQPAESSQDISINGKVVMAGSTSMESLANALAEGFMNRYPQVTVTAEFTGSSAGIEAVLAGQADIGNSSRQLHPAEQAAGGVEHVVAIDGIVIVTNMENGVIGLTREQLCGIYRGTIRNWQEVGGSNEAVVVIGREAGSGTREAFEAYLGLEDGCSYANELNSTGAVMARVSSTPGAVGYVSWEVLDDTVSVLSLEGVIPTEETIRDGRYGLSRPYVMVTKGEIEAQSRAVQEFFRYLDSEESRALLKKAAVIVSER